MSEKSTPPVRRAWPASGSWKSSSANWWGRRENRSGMGCSSIHSPAALTSTSLPASCGATAAISAAIMPPMEWPTRCGRRRPRMSTTSAVESEVEHVLEEILTGGLAVAGQLRREDVVAAGELVEKGILGEKPTRAVEEHERMAAPALQHAAAGAPLRLDRARLHRGRSTAAFSAPGVISSGCKRSSMGVIHQR